MAAAATAAEPLAPSLCLASQELFASFTLFAPINSSISVAHIVTQPSCLGAAVLGAAIRNLQLQLSPRRFWVDGPMGGLAAELAKTINDIFALFNEAFAGPIRQAGLRPRPPHPS